MTVAACVLGVRLVVRNPRRITVVAAAALVGGGVATAVFTLCGSSQVLRFASYERTAIVGLVLQAVPMSLAPQTVAASERPPPRPRCRRCPRGRAGPTPTSW